MSTVGRRQVCRASKAHVAATGFCPMDHPKIRRHGRATGTTSEFTRFAERCAELDGAVVRTIGVTGDYLRGEGEGAAAGEPRFDFPVDVLVEPRGNGALRLTLPPS